MKFTAKNLLKKYRLYKVLFNTNPSHARDLAYFSLSGKSVQNMLCVNTYKKYDKRYWKK